MLSKNWSEICALLRKVLVGGIWSAKTSKFSGGCAPDPRRSSLGGAPRHLARAHCPNINWAKVKNFSCTFFQNTCNSNFSTGMTHYTVEPWAMSDESHELLYNESAKIADIIYYCVAPISIFSIAKMGQNAWFLKKIRGLRPLAPTRPVARGCVGQLTPAAAPAPIGQPTLLLRL